MAAEAMRDRRRRKDTLSRARSHTRSLPPPTPAHRVFDELLERVRRAVQLRPDEVDRLSPTHRAEVKSLLDFAARYEAVTGQHPATIFNRLPYSTDNEGPAGSLDHLSTTHTEALSALQLDHKEPFNG